MIWGTWKMICGDDDRPEDVRDPSPGREVGVRLPFREEDADDVGIRTVAVPRDVGRLQPSLALVCWRDAGRDDEMYPVTASSQLALRDK